MTPTYAHTTRDVVTVSGPDAAAYLQGQLSQDVAALSVGASAFSFVLAPQGKVEGWGRVRRIAQDAFEIDVDPGAGEAWAARLRRFLLRTNAQIEVEADVAAVAVRGVEVEGALGAPGIGVVGGDLLRAEVGALVATPAAEAVEVGPEVLEAQRLRAGVPRWGAELDADTIPATVGQWAIDASVSFTKGCYTGQELVARIDSRGGNVPRHLLVVEVDGPPPAPGAAVEVAGEEAGTVTSSASEGDGSVALAYVKRAIEVGDDGLDATVSGHAARLVRPGAGAAEAAPAARPEG